MARKTLFRFIFTCCCLFVALAVRAEVIDIDNVDLARLTAKGVALIDIRTTGEWEQTGIVPGSVPLQFFDERGKADPAAWLAKLKGIAKPGDPVILICRSGNRTSAVSKFLSQEAGYSKVYNVKSGINSWAKEGRQMVPVTPALTACRKTNVC